MLGGDRLPEPPDRLPVPFKPEEEELSAWRLHWEQDPLEARRYPTGRYRFDAPKGEYVALYCNADRLAVFAEVYGDVHPAERLVGCLWHRPLAEAVRAASFLHAGQGVHLLAGGRIEVAVDAVELIVQTLVLAVRLDGAGDTAPVLVLSGEPDGPGG